MPLLVLNHVPVERKSEEDLLGCPDPRAARFDELARARRCSPWSVKPHGSGWLGGSISVADEATRLFAIAFSLPGALCSPFYLVGSVHAALHLTLA